MRYFPSNFKNQSRITTPYRGTLLCTSTLPKSNDPQTPEIVTRTWVHEKKKKKKKRTYKVYQAIGLETSD